MSHANQTASVVYDVKIDDSGSIDIVLVCTNLGIFRSTDAGKTFTNVYYIPFFYRPFTFDNPLTTIRVFSITLTSLGWIGVDRALSKFVLSTDHGKTWATPSDANFNWYEVTWMSAGLTSFAVGAPGDAIVYALAENYAGFNNTLGEFTQSNQLDVFKSVDGGITWKGALNGVGCNTSGVPRNPNVFQTDLNILGGQAFYDQGIVVDPDDALRNEVTIGGSFSMAQTTDAGKSWDLISTWEAPGLTGNLPLVHADTHNLYYFYSSERKKYFVVANDGGIAVSGDDGKTFSTDKNVGISAQQAVSICGSPGLPGVFIVGLQDNGSRQRAVETLPVWNSVNGGDGRGCAISQSTPQLSITSSQNNNFICDFPSNPSPFACGDKNLFQDSFFFTNIVAPQAKHDITGAYFFTLTTTSVYLMLLNIFTRIATIDLGANLITPGLDIVSFRQSYATIGVGSMAPEMEIAVCYDTAVAISSGNCYQTDVNVLVSNPSLCQLNWKTAQVTATVPNFSKCTSPLWHNGTLYLASQSSESNVPRVVKSIDRGATWVAVSSGLPDYPLMSLVADNYKINTIYAGTWAGVFFTANDGNSWNKLGSDLPNTVVTAMYSSLNKLQVATYGRGVWETDVSDITTPTSPTAVPSSKPVKQHMPVKSPAKTPYNSSPYKRPHKDDSNEDEHDESDHKNIKTV